MPTSPFAALARAAAASAAAFLLAAFSLFGEEDRQQWLEDAASERTQTWVRAHTEQTLSALTNDPLHDGLVALAADAPGPLPAYRLEAGHVWEIARDADGAATAWRRAPLASFRRGAPQWTTLIAFDAPAPDFAAVCLPPAASRCLVRERPSAPWREFDPGARAFVTGPTFALGSAHAVVWESADSVVALAVTETGSSVVRRIARGAAKPDADSVLAAAAERLTLQRLPGPRGGARLIAAAQAPSAFAPVLVLQGQAPQTLEAPAGAAPRGILGSQLILEMVGPGADPALPLGAVLALPLAAPAAGAAPVPVFVPEAGQAMDRVAVTAESVVLAWRADGFGHVARATPQRRGWRIAPVAAAEGDSVALQSVEASGSLLVAVSSWLRPDALIADVAGAQTVLAERGTALPGFEQLSLTATAPDGASVPYRLLRPAGAANDGSAPALVLVRDFDGRLGMNAALARAAWAGKGRVIAVPLPRGDAGLGAGWADQGRGAAGVPVAAADIAAVVQDLAARGIASPRRIGLWGAGEGAMLAAVAAAKTPGAFRAAVLEAPLLDLRSYARLGGDPARAARYGDPAQEAQAAAMRNWSPYDTLPAAETLPALLLLAHPDAPAAHARKTAAALEEAGKAALYGEAADAAEAAALALVFLERELVR